MECLAWAKPICQVKAQRGWRTPRRHPPGYASDRNDSEKVYPRISCPRFAFLRHLRRGKLRESRSILNYTISAPNIALYIVLSLCLENIQDDKRMEERKYDLNRKYHIRRKKLDSIIKSHPI